MISSEKIKLFSHQKQTKKNNPQQAATFQLLQISDQDCMFDPLYAATNHQQSAPKLQKQRSNYSQKKNINLKNQREIISKPMFSGFLPRTQKDIQKQSTRYISGEEVCVMKKEKVVNLSNFVVFDDCSPQVFTTIAKPELQEENKTKGKLPKNIVAYIRRRNLSYLKQQFSSQNQEKQSSKFQKKSPTHLFSPLRKIYASCQLKKSEQENNQIKPIMQIFERPLNASPQMNCTSPNFRYRKVSNYIKYKIGINKPERNIY